jgi:hypothetical protein
MTTSTSTATKVFAVLGTTDAVTVCWLCGRDELRGTIALDTLDADGNRTGKIVYYGSSCGAKAAGWTQKEFKAAVKVADQEKIDAQRAARDEESARYVAARDAYSMRVYGCDIWSVRDADGKRRPFFDIVKEFDAATAAGTI